MGFERGKDPKEILNIGLEGKLQNFLKQVNQVSDKRLHQLNICLGYGQEVFVAYLLSIGTKPSINSLRTAINKRNVNLVKMIIEVDESLKNQTGISKYKAKKMDPEMLKLIS